MPQNPNVTNALNDIFAHMTVLKNGQIKTKNALRCLHGSENYTDDPLGYQTMHFLGG